MQKLMLATALLALAAAGRAAPPAAAATATATTTTTTTTERAEADNGSAERTLALVRRAVAHLRQVGPQRAFADFSDPRGAFVDGTLYVAVNDAVTGVNLAHGWTPKVVGNSLLELQDSDGVFLIKKLIAVGNSPSHRGWVEYKWPHPLSHQWRRKRAYTERVGDVLITSGYFP
ncbi:cache domain-containing protein [Rugamonas sp. CCM 8940]|uniref:cache domain-containing protein n=1 Tax=Rugamonas sp. CCM 8940 TaxID=2765359 RepID=UPI0018F32B52|nr:cache domain-containing protein [Rugamonas sp. CCM 8940]MBJ7313807.1 cache domain-containing protein [Rugamonas sp. CCM 8940]